MRLKKGKLDKRRVFAIIVFVALEILVIIRNITSNEYLNFFWFCGFAPILFAIAFYLDEKQLIKGLINVGLLFQVFYIFLISAALLFRIDLFGFIKVLNYTPSYLLITSIIHLFSSNFALLLTYKVKPTRKALIYSALLIALMYIFGITMGSSSDNINYIHSILGFNLPYHTYSITFLFFIFIVLPTQLIQYIIYKKFSGHKIKRKTLKH